MTRGAIWPCPLRCDILSAPRCDRSCAAESRTGGGWSARMEDIHRLAKERDLSGLEAAWMERLESKSPRYDEMLSVGEYVARRVDRDLAAVLLWALVSSAVDNLGPERTEPLARRAALAVPADESLREELAGLYVRIFPDVEAMPKLVERCGLTGDAPIGAACEQLEQLARMKPGSYVVTRQSRRVSRVESFDVDEESVELRDADGLRTMRFDVALEELEVVAPDDFRAMCFFERERIAAMAKDDPVALVRLILGQAKGGRLDFRDLKAKVTAGPVDASGWSAWWKTAKPLLRRAPMIEMSTASQPTFVLRDEGLSYEAELLARFDGADTSDGAAKTALEYARERSSRNEAAPELESRLKESLRRLAAASPADALPMAAVLDQLCDACGDAEGQRNAEAIVAGIEDLPDRLAAVDDERIARRAIALSRRALPEAWPDAFEAAMRAASVKRCEALARELRGEHSSLLQRAMAEVAASLDSYPEAFIWYWRAVCDKRDPVFSQAAPASLTLSLLGLAQRLGRIRAGEGQQEAKRLRGVLRTVISAGDFAAIDRVIEEADEDMARRLSLGLRNNRGFNEGTLTALTKSLQRTHPALFEEKVAPWEDESVIWTTRAALDRRRREYDHLINVKLLENSRAIGEAASRGDLSENAEWTAAVEEQKHLAERAARMDAELAKARVLTPEMCAGDCVTVGVRVRARNLTTGGEDTLTFLGPWDLDIEGNVLSYKAPLSLAFMGRAIGDRVAAGEGEHRQEFEIVAFESAV